MKKVGLFEAKQKLSELVERASEGERIGITRRGKLTAVLSPPSPQGNLKELFQELEGLGRRVRQRAGRKLDIRELIEEGRT